MSLTAYTVKNSNGDIVPLPNNYIATGYLTYPAIIDNNAAAPTPSDPTQGSLSSGWNAPNYITSFPSTNVALYPSTITMNMSDSPGFKFANEGIYEITLNFAFGYATQNGIFPTTNLFWDQYFALSTSPTELISPGVVPNTTLGGFGFLGYNNISGDSSTTAIMYQNLSGNTSLNSSSSSSSMYNINQRVINDTTSPALYYQFQGQYYANGCYPNTYTFTATIYAQANTTLYPLMKLANTGASTNSIYMQLAEITTPYQLPFTCELVKSGTPFSQPTQPTGLYTTTSSNGDVTLNWTPTVTQNNGSKVYLNGEYITTITTQSLYYEYTSTISDASTLGVTSVIASGEESPMAMVQYYVPGLVATITGDCTINSSEGVTTVYFKGDTNITPNNVVFNRNGTLSMLVCVGGGGGGGGGGSTYKVRVISGGGGGAGGIMKAINVPVSGGVNIDVVCGFGGEGGGGYNYGSSGGDSSWTDASNYTFTSIGGNGGDSWYGSDGVEGTTSSNPAFNNMTSYGGGNGGRNYTYTYSTDTIEDPSSGGSSSMSDGDIIIQSNSVIFGGGGGGGAGNDIYYVQLYSWGQNGATNGDGWGGEVGIYTTESSTPTYAETATRANTGAGGGGGWATNNETLYSVGNTGGSGTVIIQFEGTAVVAT